MFSKILIANRGEIACRIIKTAKKMGITTVAVYSDADVDAMHKELADEAVNIGLAPAVDSYLCIDRIIAACLETEAQAVHPGYGFLSENAKFAEKLADNNIAFIGPNIKAIEVMGDKISSKKFANQASVNTVPGYLGIIEDKAQAVSIAEEIGYPVMVKASAGGGGKGMRVAHNSSELGESFVSAMSEAKSSFGDDRVFIEKFIINPRHIEMQVLGDKFGNIIHLAERECSIQRRNQKVIEEAPSSFLDLDLRKKMGRQAIELAKEVDYESAGTVEFIIDQNKNFYFLEMNTRLQVEHPVTELITGIDLVEQMIRIAYGEKLKLTQQDIKINGWAIESRIYAEDPYRGFLPSIGRIKHYLPPPELDEDKFIIRNDTGIREGDDVSIYYDPMIAKLCSWAKDRATAIEQMTKALNSFYISGIKHNIEFLASVMLNDRWRKGEISTDFIAQEYGDQFCGGDITFDIASIAISVAAHIDFLQSKREVQISGQIYNDRLQDINCCEKTAVCISYYDRKLEGKYRDIKLNASSDFDKEIIIEHCFENKDKAFSHKLLSDWVIGNNLWNGNINGIEINVIVEKVINGYRITYNGISVNVYIYECNDANLLKLMPIKETPDTSQSLVCPMPGIITSIMVKEGDKVRYGDTLCIIEAMKMENILKAERDLVISTINYNQGDNISVDDIIMEFSY